MKWCLACAALFLLNVCSIQSLNARESSVADEQAQEARSDTARDDWWGERFEPHELNYVMWQESRGDESAIEVQYSLKFLVFDHRKKGAAEQRSGAGSGRASTYSFFVSYTGIFDFYMGTRYSGPVINRTSNPAAHLRYDRGSGDRSSGWWIGLAFEHRSNGQATDANGRDNNPSSATYRRYLTEIEYGKGNHEYFDYISRSANYFTASYGLWGSKRGTAELSYKLYLENREEEITWGEYGGTSTGFSDFDSVRLRLKSTIARDLFSCLDIGVGGDLTIGNKVFDTNFYSYDLYGIFTFRPGRLVLPFMMKAHYGPMDRLSDYSKSISSLGVGLALFY